MANESKLQSVVDFPSAEKGSKKSSHEKIWGKSVLSHGYAGIPSILIRSQKRLGLSPLQMNIVIQLLDYWFEPSRPPFPTKKDLAERMGVTPKTIQNNIRELEAAGLIQRVQRKTAAGDWGSNIYELDKLVERIRSLEPEFAEAKKLKQMAKKIPETPISLRSKAS